MARDFNCDAADENITIFLCAWINVMWELSDNNVVTMSHYRRLLSLLLDAFQTYILYQHKILIIGKLLATVLMVGKLLVNPNISRHNTRPCTIDVVSLILDMVPNKSLHTHLLVTLSDLSFCDGSLSHRCC